MGPSVPEEEAVPGARMLHPCHRERGRENRLSCQEAGTCGGGEIS